MLKYFDDHWTKRLLKNSLVAKRFFKITSYFILYKKNVRKGTWRKLSDLFCRYSFMQIFLLSTLFFLLLLLFSRKCYPEFFNFSLAPRAIFGWPPQYSRVFREPVRTQPDMMLQGQTQYCFTQTYFLTYLRQSSQHLDLSFIFPWSLFSKFSSHNLKNSSECYTVFNIEEVVKHFCDAKKGIF